MTQIDVALTDYGLTVLCLWFTYRLWTQPQPAAAVYRWQQNLWVIFFSSLAFGSLTGGTVHGFFPEPASFEHRAMWMVTVFAIGCTAATGWLLIGTFWSNVSPLKSFWTYFAFVDFLIYATILIFYSHSFLVVILHYAPAMTALMIISLRFYFRTRAPSPLWVTAGLAVSFLAAFIQQTKIAVSPTYFDHNSTFHAVQAVGLYLIFLGAKGLINEAKK